MAENLMTRKIGPLPTWGWTAIVGGGVLVWAWYQRSQASSQASAATTSATQPPTVYQIYPTEQEGETGAGEPEKHHRHRRRVHIPVEPCPEGYHRDPETGKCVKGPEPHHHHPHRHPKKRGGGGTGPPTRRPRRAEVA